mmetsp:Transcript_17586/g.24281  ORF Transcript_17586/g.24281 Transcript_17586/m.24281 type:complete len:203 (-) Transcript_17586:167-775(-)
MKSRSSEEPFLRDSEFRRSGGAEVLKCRGADIPRSTSQSLPDIYTSSTKYSLDSNFSELRADLLRSISKHAKSSRSNSLGATAGDLERAILHQRRTSELPAQQARIPTSERPIYGRAKRHLHRIRMPCSLPNHCARNGERSTKRFSAANTPRQLSPRLTRKMSNLGIDLEESLAGVRASVAEVPIFHRSCGVFDICVSQVPI